MKVEFTKIKDVSFLEEVEEIEEEVVFREDAAWRKSTRKTTRELKSTKEIHSQKENSFSKDLQVTLEWMKNTRKYSEKLVLNVSERSREYEAYFPTFTPSFLGDVITDEDLEKVLVEFQELKPQSPSQKKSKKKRKKSKTITRAESEITLAESDETRDTRISDPEYVNQTSITCMRSKEEEGKILEISRLLQELKDEIDYSKENVRIILKDLGVGEWRKDIRTRFHGLLLDRNEASIVQCITLRLEHIFQVYKKIFERKGRLYGFYYREIISMDLAKLLTPFPVDDGRWLQSVTELQSDVSGLGWISLLVDVDEKTWTELKDSIDEINLEFKGNDQILFPTTVAQNLRHTSSLFDESVVLEFLAEKEEEIAFSSQVVCIINFGAFMDLGKILSLAQREGFCLTGMHTIRMHKEHVNDMFSNSLYDIRSKVVKLFCHGPSIILSLHRSRARATLNSTLESKYEKCNDTPLLFSERILVPFDEYMSKHWFKIFFPNGPASEIKYTQIGNQLVHSSIPLFFHTTGGAEAPSHHRNYDFFTVVFLSISNRISENLASWGDILSKILKFKSAHVQIRIENCNLVNCSAKVAREVASGCDLDPLGTLRLLHRLRNGYCLMMRLGTTQALFNKLCDTDVLEDPHVFYVPQLDGLYNRLNI